MAAVEHASGSQRLRPLLRTLFGSFCNDCMSYDPGTYLYLSDEIGIYGGEAPLGGQHVRDMQF